MSKQTPMQRQYLQLKRQYPDCILMYQLGDFHEMFNEDAKIASKILDIVLTSRGEGVDKWPMCGVPNHSVDGYIAKLLQAGYTVAIARQVEDVSQAKGLVKRDVVRVVTPGTVLESTMLDDTTNNYLVSLVQHDDLVGISAVDVSTGEFLASEFNATLDSETTMNEIGKYSPAEILLPDSVSKSKLRKILEEMGIRITFRNDTDYSTRTAEERLKEQFGVTTLEGYGLGNKRVALGAAGAVLAYLHDVHKTGIVTVTGIKTYSIETNMIVDATTQRNLELVKNGRDGTTRGTLLSVLSKTVTPMGKRKLKQWMLRPLRDIKAIEKRQDAIEELARGALNRKGISDSLRDLGDLERMTSRIIFGSANARDLLALGNALAKLPKIKKALSDCESQILRESADSIDTLSKLHKTLKSAIVDDPPVSVRDGGMILKGFSKDLDELRDTISSDKKWIASLQASERRRTGIKTLKVGFNKVFGYYIEVSKSNLSLVPEEYERKQTLANAERFITPELKERESTVLAGEERINQLEFELYEELRDEVRQVTSITG